MKRMLNFMCVALAAVTAMSSCNKDNYVTTSGEKVSEVVVRSFEQRYPDARNVVWETKSTYWVAHFDLPTKAASAIDRDNTTWFDNNGAWQMSEHEIAYQALPQAVRTAFESGKYAGWEKDDINVLTREGVVELYVIEVEKEIGDEDFDMELYYTEDGILTKEVPSSDDHTDLIPEVLPQAVLDDLAKRFPEYQCIEAEFEDNYFEVEIFFGKKVYELNYTKDCVWQMTKSELSLNEVPAVVTDALKAGVADLEKYEFDEIELIENADGKFYRFELEHKVTDKDIELVFSENGERIPVK